MSISPVGLGGLGGLRPLTTLTATPEATGAATGADFGAAVAKSVDGLQAMQTKADGLAIEAATGDLSDVHEFTIAATEAKLATELTVAVRNKAVEAFTEIMRMPV